MPPYIKEWTDASSVIGEKFIPNESARPGVSCGYFLPEPAMIANLSNDKTRQVFLHTFLKLKVLLYYCVQVLGVDTSHMLANDWQKVLGLEHLGVKEGTNTSIQWIKIQEDLQSTLEKNSNLVCILCFASDL
ncbi:hypothetical protein BDP27DRAFT_1228333 [Rhodocollybia butyracea]|uniref:Uncharacterized protein n=1 Tax=Rhodocollybia butyracea TaxID=206335 RepID=A0A9P5U4I0_9AGAR|nr:hypothetical protein BDP27DRAFT_1228333 [Rhodocollybia butyracea]